MMWPSNNDTVKWWHEAHRILDRCKCGGFPTMDKGLIGYRVSCVCGKQTVDPTALHAYLEWNKLMRGVNSEV